MMVYQDTGDGGSRVCPWAVWELLQHPVPPEEGLAGVPFVFFNLAGSVMIGRILG